MNQFIVDQLSGTLQILVQSFKNFVEVISLFDKGMSRREVEEITGAGQLELTLVVFF